MIRVNPFTGMLINENPEGCNQHTGPDCSGSSRQGYYERITDTSRLTKVVGGSVEPATLLESEQLKAAISRWGTKSVHKLIPDVVTIRDGSKPQAEREAAAKRVLDYYDQKRKKEQLRGRR